MTTTIMSTTSSTRNHDPSVATVQDNEAVHQAGTKMSPTNGGEETRSRNNSNKPRNGEAFRKGPWMPREDELLMRFVREHGASAWNTAHVFYPELRRCGKSCRLRYVNQLRHDLRKDPLTPHEERIILLGHARQGNQWSKIAAMLPGRTDNHVKNFVYMMKKKRQRQNNILHGSATRHASTSSAGNFLNYQANAPLPTWQATVNGCFSSLVGHQQQILRDRDGGQGFSTEYGNSYVVEAQQQMSKQSEAYNTVNSVNIQAPARDLNCQSIVQDAQGRHPAANQHEASMLSPLAQPQSLIQPSAIISSVISDNAALISRVLDHDVLRIADERHLPSARLGYALSYPMQQQQQHFMFDSKNPQPVVSDFTMELPSVQQQQQPACNHSDQYAHSYDLQHFTSPDETTAAPSVGYSQDLDLLEAFTLSSGQGTGIIDPSAYGDSSVCPYWPRWKPVTNVKLEADAENGLIIDDADICSSGVQHVQSPDSVLAP